MAGRCASCVGINVKGRPLLSSSFRNVAPLGFARMVEWARCCGSQPQGACPHAAVCLGYVHRPTRASIPERPRSTSAATVPQPRRPSLQADATTCRSPGSVDCPGFFFVAVKKSIRGRVEIVVGRDISVTLKHTETRRIRPSCESRISAPSLPPDRPATSATLCRRF